MKFKNFYKNYQKEVLDELPNPFGVEIVEERAFQVWLIYNTIKTNRKLVFATWGLAIATIILSGISIYFQYFN